MQSIDNQAKKIRKTKKISQGEAAKALGLSQGALSQRESGIVDFKSEEIKKLANLYGVPVEAFYDNEYAYNTLAEPEVKYERVDLGMDAINNRFVLVMRRYMANLKIKTIVDLSERMRVDTNHLTAISSGHKNVSMPILAKSVMHCSFNGNYVLGQSGDYFQAKSDVKGMVAELTENYERMLSDRDKVIRSYEALLKSHGIEI